MAISESSIYVTSDEWKKITKRNTEEYLHEFEGNDSK